MRRALFFWFVFSVLWQDRASAAVVTCQGVNDTAAIQAAVTLEDTKLEGSCFVNGATPILVPANRKVTMTGATVTMLPGCARSSPPCTLFQSAPNVVGTVELIDGTLVGYLTPAIGFQIAVRFGEGIVPAAGQKYSGIVRGTTFQNWRSEAIQVGGNTPPRGILITGVTIDTFGRNGVSVVNANGVWFQHSTCRNAVLIQGLTVVTPGACIDVESNPGSDLVQHVTVSDVHAEDVEICYYFHKNINAPAQGHDYHISHNTCLRPRQTALPGYTSSGGVGIVVNSSENVYIDDNIIDSASRIGISIGAFSESTRARHVYVNGNMVVRTPRGMVVAGAEDIHMLSNDLGGTQVETVALGVRPPLTLQTQPAPTPTPCQ